MNTVGQQVFRGFSDITDLLATWIMLGNTFLGAVLHFNPTHILRQHFLPNRLPKEKFEGCIKKQKKIRNNK